MEEQIKANPEFLGAFTDNHLVGTVIVSCDMRKAGYRLAVTPDHRRRGIAKTLVAESGRILRKRDRRILCALIKDYNTVYVSTSNIMR